MLTDEGNRKHPANVSIPSCAAVKLGACLCSAVDGYSRRSEGGDSVARLLGNRDAGNPDARHFADGHLEQEIQHLEGFAVPACQWSGGVHGVILSVGLNRQVGTRGRSIRQQEFHGVDGIFLDHRGPWILVDMVFRVFSKRSAQKVEHGIEAPQSELSLEGVFSSNMPWADVEGYVVGVPFLCFVDQSSPLIGRERVRVIVGDERSSQDLFAKGIGIVFLAIGDEIFFL